MSAVPDMDKLSFHFYPSRALREVCKPCDDEFFSTLKPIVIGRMLQLCDQMRGYAVSANQVGIPYQFFVIKRSDGMPKSMPQMWCNPEIVGRDGTILIRESCLSIPGMLLSLRRPASVAVKFIDGADGKSKVIHCRGLLARVVQHEIEHLQGKLFTDNLTGLNKQDADKFLKNMARTSLASDLTGR